MSEERRGFERAPVEVGAAIFVGSKRIRCRLLNVSASGLGLLTSSQEVPRAAIRVDFLLPEDSSPISTDAILVHHRQQGAEVQWGVMLLSPAPEVTARLGDFVGKVLGVEPPADEEPSSEPRGSGVGFAAREARAKLEERRKLRLQALMRRAVEGLDS